jgi:DNA-binding MarR family transcriptional regulator
VSKAFYHVETFRSVTSLGYLVRRIHTLLMPRAEALFADAELSFSQWVVLVALRDGIGDTCAGIARHMNHDTGATTRLVDQLEARGLIKRRRSTADRRVVHLALLPAGKAVAKALTPRIVDFLNRVLGDFTEKECVALLDMLTRLNRRLEQEQVEPVAVKEEPAKPRKGRSS